MGNAIRDWARTTKPVLISYIIARSVWNRTKFASGNISYQGGATTVHKPIEDSIAYIKKVFGEFWQYGELTEAKCAGTRMLEWGPGDNVGCALLFIAKGVEQVRLMDKFYAPHDEEQERRIYLKLREGLNADEKRRFDAAVSLDGKLQFNEETIRYEFGKGGEEADEVFPENHFDIILSRGVLQGLDLDRAYATMMKLLKPGGLTLHKSDLRDHGMFSANGFHPLEFLTISDGLYKVMTEGTDRPNRRHLHDYRRAGAQYGLEQKLLRTGIINPPYLNDREVHPNREHFRLGVEYTQQDLDLARAIRPRLRPQFQGLSDDDLMTSGVFVVGRKPL